MDIRILSVAEKPSVAKELANIISENGQYNRRSGFSPYNQIYEIQNCKFKGNPAFMKITSVTGHMMEQEFEQPYCSWTGCQPSDLFYAPITKQIKKDCLNIKKTLIDEIKQCNTLLLWLDCDLEGENIAYEVIQVCLESNPRIDIYRARFSALITRDILRTLQHPDRPNPHFNDAVEARQEIDLRLGAAFTRFQTKRLQNRYDNLGNSVISYGPCQFPTLGFVVERHAQIQKFRPETFWSIQCEYECDDITEKSGKLSCSFRWDRNCLYDRYSCLVLYDICVKEGGDAKVIKCEQRPTTRARPSPMNTIELQKRASRFLHMPSDRTMHIAESLYQRGILSYPRTETDFFKEGFELLPLLNEHRNHSLWGNFVTKLLDEDKFLWPKSGGHDDQAHPPIHPTKCIELSELQNNDEKQLYELISRHFLASCAQDGLGNLTNISIRIPANSWHAETFSASGLMITERNWLDVYGKFEHWSASKVPTLRGK
jgi:DNA topoisomerase-3